MLILVLTLGLELLLYKGLWRFRNALAIVIAVIIGIWSGTLILSSQPLWVSLLLIVNVFRVINLTRIVKARMHERYLHRVSTRTGAYLGVFSLIVAGIAHILRTQSYLELWLGAAVIQIVAAGVIIIITARNLHKTRHRPGKHYYSDKELPPVTVAIPARNETADLTSCLTSVLASDYPKLEVLVLDDCSQDKTSEIIKAFAQDGVRFLKGNEPKPRWLAKNQAYDQLAEAASGEFIIFCGVDVRFGPSTVRSLVSSALHKSAA